MKFVSTRGGDSASFSQAVMRGLARDGGLFVPEKLPNLAPYLNAWRDLSYPELAHKFLSLFATDIPEADLRHCVNQAYAKLPAPLVSLREKNGPDLRILELFHGPTLAFKDFALQLLGQLYGWHVRSTGKPVNILGATSGDTGSAAIHGMLAQPDTHCFILYPEGRIAPLQERQIAATGSPNVHPLAIHGSFDDAQDIVKRIFGDADFTRAQSLTAVNSINIARILAQCVYYLSAALRLGAGESAPVEFVVPTGNFGNVLAGWMLGKMGVAGLRFQVATSVNDVISHFFQTGEYRRGKVIPSLAPSMDIQQASNFERWLWYHFSGDTARVCAALADVRERGLFTLPAAPVCQPPVRATACDDEGIRANIARIYRETGYMLDPHTACAFVGEPRNDARRVVLATAHPAKFPETVSTITGVEPTHPTLEALKAHPIKKQVLSPDIDAVRHAITTTLTRA